MRIPHEKPKLANTFTQQHQQIATTHPTFIQCRRKRKFISRIFSESFRSYIFQKKKKKKREKTVIVGAEGNGDCEEHERGDILSACWLFRFVYIQFDVQFFYVNSSAIYFLCTFFFFSGRDLCRCRSDINSPHLFVFDVKSESNGKKNCDLIWLRWQKFLNSQLETFNEFLYNYFRLLFKWKKKIIRRCEVQTFNRQLQSLWTASGLRGMVVRQHCSIWVEFWERFLYN